MIFTPGQVRALCGGAFPYANGFGWDCVEYFRLEEDGVLEPYGMGDILPGPGLRVTINEERILFLFAKSGQFR